MDTESLTGEKMPASQNLLPKLVLSILFFILVTFIAGRFYVIVDKDIYLGAHIIMEFVGVVVAICSSLMSWYNYKYKHELRALVFCLIFCVAAILEFAHALSYMGMPDFITPNSVNKASTYWVLFNLLLSAGLLAAVISGNKVKKVKHVNVLLSLAGLAAVLLVIAVAWYLPYLPPMYDPLAGSQTRLKIYLEYTIIVLLLLAMAKMLQQGLLTKQGYYLCLALFLGTLSEVAFTFYSNAYDIYNLLGHILKVFSYGYIFTAISEEAVGRIYETNGQLEKQKELLAEANRQLQVQDRLKDEFLANTNHELRTPLAAIIAFTELLMDPSTGELNNLQMDYLKEINDSSKELLNRINGFLDLSKIASGKTVVYKEVFSVNDLIEDIIFRMKPLFNNKGVELQVQSHCPGSCAFADREKAGQVLTNLLFNALKFTPPNGSVLVESSLEEYGEAISISVKDTGIGIDEQELENIFKPFYQVDGSSSRSYGGTGIGLTLAKKLTELNNGTITVTSKRYQGSTFTFTLPSAEGEGRTEGK